MSRLGDILSELVKAERKTLLWTNPNPTSAFESQTASVPTTYDAYEIVYIGFTGQPAYKTSSIFCHPKESGALGYMTYITGASGQLSGSLFIFKRDCWIVDGGIRFGGAYRATPTESWARYTADTGIVPYKIYGIKHYGS